MKVTNPKGTLAQPALTFKTLRQLMTFCAVLFVFAAKAQNSAHDVVMYDPLFWKDELSLRHAQSRKIEQINNEFYDNIRQVKEQASREAKNTALERGLQERSQKIFEALQPKQRRKLERIIDKTSPVTAP